MRHHRSPCARNAQLHTGARGRAAPARRVQGLEAEEGVAEGGDREQ